jgi:large subunit ribosomal protein L19
MGVIKIIEDIENSQKRKNNFKFKVGDTVKVFSKIVEGSKERVQGFEGIVLRRSGGGNREVFTVRKIVQGVGGERIFPIHSPKIERVETLKSGKVRRAKLYYMRKRKGGSAMRINEGKADVEAA